MLYCFISDFINTMNDKVYNALWCSKWYEINNIVDKKKVLFLMTIMQKPVGFSTGGMTLMSIPIFTKVSSIITKITLVNFINYFKVLNVGYNIIRFLNNVIH